MNTNVERTTLAPGLEISRVLTGLWQIADLEKDGSTVDLDACAGAMAPYVEAGFTTFDMADHYGSAEDIAGVFRASRARDAQILTKWVPKPGAATRDDVRAAVQRSLDRLRAQRIDLLQFHAWAYDDPAWLDCLFWLSELVDEGLIGHLGLTNFDAAHLDMILHTGVPIVSNQVCFSLIDRRASGAMTEACRRHDVKLLAYGTVSGGLLTERWLGQPEPDWDELGTWSSMKYKRFIDAAGSWGDFQALLDAVHGVALRLGVSMANVASRWVLEQPAVGGVIIGARLGRSEHIADNLRLFDFELDDDARSDLAEAMSRLGPIPGGCGDEYRKPPFLTAAGDLSDHFDEFPAPYETRDGPRERVRVLSGTPWEEIAGFSRGVRDGNRVLISGTTATHRDRLIGGSDPAAQTHFVIDKIEGALRSLGASLEDVVRTRVYVHDAGRWEPISRAHGQRFGHVRPANTLVHAGLIGDGYLVEMEAEAVVW
jgi:aryl-alcohol dehydrogenase-like predicted oxidoreductase/enamine deaminase RidA (YjgF/YER057c/UK114 family)